MRLNFSGVTEEQIREGVRRIGKVVAEQVALYGTLTGSRPPAPPTPAVVDEDDVGERLADVLELPRRERPARRGRAESDR
jgi:2-aminoadipate transaminase